MGLGGIVVLPGLGQCGDFFALGVKKLNLEVRQQSGDSTRLTQSASLSETVVWNPGVERCAALNDLPPDGYRHMLCVEAACINTPVMLAPGQSWSGWQALDVLPAA